MRSPLAATLLEPQIRHEIQSIDSGVPVFGVSSMDDVLDASLAPRRFSADLVGGFAALAVLLVIIGVIIWSHGTRVPPVAAPATTAHKLHLTPAQPSIEPRQQ